MCERDDDTAFRTTMCFQDEASSNVINLCVEHMDALVSAALDRHKRELESENQHWYETPDGSDEMEELAEMERQLADEQVNRLVEEEAERWQTG
jgi:hypothetical protein